VSGAVSVGDAALVVAKRGRAMQAAADALGVPGKMAVLLLARRDEVQNVLKEQGDFVQIASVNSPKQIVISGPASRVDTAVKEIKDRKFARRVRELDVSAPFHCDVMVPAAQELAELLDSIDIKQPQIPIVSFCQAGAAAQAVVDIQAIKKGLVEQVYRPVLWADGVEFCMTQGVRWKGLVSLTAQVDEFWEMGPGSVLGGLVKECAPSAKCTAIDTDEDVDAVVQSFKTTST